MGIQINGAQARALIEVLQDFAADEPVELTKHLTTEGGDLVVGFVLATVTIRPTGEIEVD